LHHAADETVFKKLHEAQAKGKPDDAAHGGQIVN
jgi:hypothetical protein